MECVLRVLGLVDGSGVELVNSVVSSVCGGFRGGYAVVLT